MQTPTPITRVAPGSLVPTPNQRNPIASTSTDSVGYRPFASGAAAPALFRQSLGAASLFRSRAATQTPVRQREEPKQQVAKVESPYRVLGAAAANETRSVAFTRPDPATAPASPTTTPQRLSADVVKLSPSSANAVGRARAAKRLRRGLVIAFFWIMVSTARPVRYMRGSFADRAPLAFQAYEWLSLVLAFWLLRSIGVAIYQLAIPGAAPAVTSVVLPRTPQQITAQPSGAPAPASSPSGPTFVKSSPKTRPEPLAAASPSALSKSYSSSALVPASHANTPPPPKRASPTRGSPSRFFVAEGPPTDEQLRRSLLGNGLPSVGSGTASALAAFQARQSPQASFTSRRASGAADLDRLKADAAIAAAG